MSVRASSSVWRSSLSEGSSRLILLALADNADDDGLCWPSVALLARKARVSESTVHRALAALVAGGDLTIDEGGGRKSNRYHVTIYPDTGVRLTPHKETMTPLGSHGDTPAVSPMTPESSVEASLEPGVRPTVRVPRARLRDTYGEDARRGVAAYADSRKSAGLPVSRDVARLLPRPFMKLRSEGWTQDLCLRAVQTYAATNRSPLYFREWVMQEFHAEGDRTHEAYSEEILRDGSVAADTLAAMVQGFKSVA